MDEQLLDAHALVDDQLDVGGEHVEPAVDVGVDEVARARLFEAPLGLPHVHGATHAGRVRQLHHAVVGDRAPVPGRARALGEGAASPLGRIGDRDGRRPRGRMLLPSTGGQQAHHQEGQEISVRSR